MITFIGIESGPAGFYGFWDCIIEATSLGKSTEFERYKFSFICIILVLFLLYSISSTVFLSWPGFDGFPIDFGTYSDDISTTF